jgi:hypothetical protein
MNVLFQDSFGYRVSTRSSYSIADSDANDISYRSHDQLVETIQNDIKQVRTWPMFSKHSRIVSRCSSVRRRASIL